MKGKYVLFLTVVSLLLCGCGLFEGSYVHVTPYTDQSEQNGSEVISASNLLQLRSVVEAMVGQGMESGVIHVADFDQELLEKHMNEVAVHVQQTYPVGAYAVEKIEYEIGTSSGRPAIAVTITYRHGRVEIQRIRSVRNMEAAVSLIGSALDNLESLLVIKVEEYSDTDFAQIVRDYAEEHPDSVMEIPQVTAADYGTGESRVVELNFTYQTSRDSMRTMQSQVQTVFDSAALYVSGEASDLQKFSQLYGFLMERFDYSLETSITPAYSLLCHGVGDSRAFAVVYGAMCRQAGLDCQIVVGTKDAEPWVWNMICDNGTYFHVDLLRSSQAGGFREYVDGEMGGYVWDYSAYPKCTERYSPSEEIGNSETEPQESAPTEPAPEESTELIPEESTEILE